jgi:Mrp family chromosome partitioning ATPase
MSTSTAPRYSTRELQAAANALAAGQFSTATARTEAPSPEDLDTRPVSGSLDSTTDSTTAGVGDPHESDTVGTRRPIATATVSTGSAPLVRVRAANAGAGASTIALALAEAADVAGIRTRVLDAAAPTWSGLLGATVTELGAAEGWRRGRRGNAVLIDRVEATVNIPAEVPSPRSVDGVDLTVLDAGWSMRELVASGAGAWVTTTPAAAEVLVTRPHGLALSQTEAALAELEDQLEADQVVVVVVGAGRWSDREFATAGRLLRTAHRQEAVLFAPLLPAKALPGLGPGPLPKQLTSPSQRLLERITTITGPLTANRN